MVRFFRGLRQAASKAAKAAKEVEAGAKGLEDAAKVGDKAADAAKAGDKATQVPADAEAKGGEAATKDATDASKEAKKAAGVLKGELDATADRLLKRHGFTYDPATGVAINEETRATAFRNSDGLWIYNDGAKTITEHTVLAHYGDAQAIGTRDFFQGFSSPNHQRATSRP